MKKNAFIGIAMLFCITVKAQVVVTQLSVPYTQNFDSLSDTSLTNSYSTLPAGWKAEEVGSGANTEYRAAWGQLSGGDLYSFGDSAVAERALGSLGSGSVGPVYFGVALINNTGGTVQTVQVRYRGELWRVGNPARTTGPDTLHVAFGKNNGDLHSKTWTSAPKLNYISPAPSTSTNNIPLNGNAAAQVTNYLDTIGSLNLANGDTLWFRWRDENSSSFDDGMGIDSVSITFLPNVTPPLPPPSLGLLAFTAFNTYYYQNFDTIRYSYPSNHSFATLPFGWFAKETGTNGDNTYKTAYGEFAGGNLYSFGDSTSTERALGSIGSGTNDKTHFGVAFINTTGHVINNVEIKYLGEMWRQGRPQRGTGPDTLHFSYSTDATSIDVGNYQGNPMLSFYSPVTNGVLNTPMNGNLAANRTSINGIVGNLGLQQGDTLWLRWTDFDSDSYDDGLAIDSVAVVPVQPSALLNVEFKNKKTFAKESDGIVRVPVVVHNKSNFLTQVKVFLADTGTVDLSTDVTLASSIVSFPGSLPDTIAYFQLGVSSTKPFEADEYFVLGMNNVVNGLLGQTIYDTIHIQNYQYPQVTISTLTSDDAQGMPDSMNKNYVIEGTVHGVNYSAAGDLDFYVLQNGAGINVYQPTMPSYTPVAGDKVKVWGAIGQFRGLTRMEMPDSVQLISGGNLLETPKVINKITESEESAYVIMDSLKLYPALTNWPNNAQVYAINAATNDTIAIYISANTDLAGKSAPSNLFTLTGIGSQFNNSTNPPYDNGYRIMAINRNMVVPAGVDGIAEENGQLAIYPNPTQNEFTISGKGILEAANAYGISGQCIWSGGSIELPLTIQTQNWKAGAYNLQVIINGQKKNYKLIKL